MSSIFTQFDRSENCAYLSNAVTSFAPCSNLPKPDLTGQTYPIWITSVIGQLRCISSLKDGWDGFRSGPIRRDVVSYTGKVLEEVMRPTTPAPKIAPMSHEGLMLEWHQDDIDLEIEIEKAGAIWVSFSDKQCQGSIEVELFSDLSPLTEPISRLTDRASKER